jgi:hypothetical protein
VPGRKFLPCHLPDGFRPAPAGSCPASGPFPLPHVGPGWVVDRYRRRGKSNIHHLEGNVTDALDLRQMVSRLRALHVSGWTLDTVPTLTYMTGAC